MSRKRRNRKNRNNNNPNNTLIVDRKKNVFTYTVRLEAILLDISDNVSHAIMGCYNKENNHNFSLIDLCDRPHQFKVHIGGRKPSYMKIEEFLNKFFDSKFHKREIDQFVEQYNKRIPKTKGNIDYYLVDKTPFLEERFEYKPKDVLYTFCSLCSQTYPHGTEAEVIKYMPIPLIKDTYGNYYIKIGESDTMFTSHLDSACRDQSDVKLLKHEKDNQVFITSDGKSILSADDKAGVTIMLYMIEHKVPGLYYFFLGEERGGIGSGMLAGDYHMYDYLENIKKCISFDRRNYHSIITHQGSVRCCSDDFGQALCNELNKNGMSMSLDITGLFTDSANFTDEIGECTNISVGYFREHTTEECQNVSFLDQLCKACVKVEWDKLLVKKKAGINREVISRNEPLLTDFKKLSLYSQTKLKASDDRVFIEIRMASSIFDETYDDVCNIYEVLSKHAKEESVIYFTDDYDGTVLMNIELE